MILSSRSQQQSKEMSTKIVQVHLLNWVGISGVSRLLGLGILLGISGRLGISMLLGILLLGILLLGIS